jgi:hypothetical protein
MISEIVKQILHPTIELPATHHKVSNLND